jgi:hypothetical protein
MLPSSGREVGHSMFIRIASKLMPDYVSENMIIYCAFIIRQCTVFSDLLTIIKQTTNK